MNEQLNHRTSSQTLLCPDLLALVVFAEKAAMISPFVSAYDPNFKKAVMSLPDQIASCTNLTAGIRLSTELLSQAPRGLRRRVWCLSDGQDNVETDLLAFEVARARKNHININTIAFGFDAQASPDRLASVSAGTRTGRFVSVGHAKRLGQVLKDTPRRNQAHQGEATVFCIDVSPSMRDVAGRGSKIEIVRDVMLNLIEYKQKMWS